MEHPDHDSMSDEQASQASQRVISELAELQPTDATQGLLGAQMLGAHRLAMMFMSRAALPNQTPEGLDANVQRAGKMMRIFMDQSLALAKLKGKGGQQRVVVEHVNVGPVPRRCR